VRNTTRPTTRHTSTPFTSTRQSFRCSTVSFPGDKPLQSLWAARSTRPWYSRGTASLRSTTSLARDSRYDFATRNTQHATRNTQHATRNTQHATRNTQHATRNTHHATRNTQHATRNTQHATRNTQHATRNTQHATRPLILAAGTCAQEAFLTAVKYLEQTEREHSAYCASSTVVMHRMVPHSLIPPPPSLCSSMGLTDNRST
jgi:FtsZ-interacting cell division protein ZipA